MNITSWPIENVHPYPRNARRIPQKAIDKVAASIREFGWHQPIVVDLKGVILCGHVRLLAARKLGLKQVPVHVADNLTPAQVRAYRSADNRSHEETSWVEELLGPELLDLKELGYDLSLTGFDMPEIDDLLSAPAEPEHQIDLDHLPAISEKVVCQPGDLWVLDNHRLFCGDSTARASIARVLDGAQADMVFTNLPVDCSQPVVPFIPHRNGKDSRDFEKVLTNFCTALLALTNGAIYLGTSPSQIEELKRIFTQAGGHWASSIIWVKALTSCGSDYQRQYQPILYGWRRGGERYWCGGQDQGDVWFIDDPLDNPLNGSLKPVALAERAIANSSKPGALVLDPFGGSGTTLIACEKSGRCARVIELDPSHVDQAVTRWEKFTGKKAVLESYDGSLRSFDELADILRRSWDY